MPYIKGPTVVSLDFKAGIANRYLRRFDVSGAGLGWRVECVGKALFTPLDSLPSAAVESFRVTGAV